MALIKCPECQRDISDRAHNCPVCGFPLDEYFEEQRKIEEERERIEREKQRQKDLEIKEKAYLKRTEFQVGDLKLIYDHNEKISAVIGAYFQIRKEALYKKVQNMLLDGENDSPVDFGYNSFGSFAKELMGLLVHPLMNEAECMCARYCTQFDREYFFEEIQSVFDADAMYQDLVKCHQEAYSTYELNAMNAHVQYGDEYIEAGAPVQVIDEVYSHTLMGLVGKSISAHLVNGVTEALTSGRVKRKEKAAADKYHETMFKEALICNAKVYGTLYGYIEGLVEAYMDFTFEYLEETGEIFQIKKYPLEEVDFKKYIMCLDDEKKTNRIKKENFLYMIKNNPGDFFIYAEALMGITFTKEELKEIIRLVHFLGLSNDIKRTMVNNQYPYWMIVDNESQIEEYLEAVELVGKTYGGRVFSTIDEKELYVVEQDKYSNKLKEFLEFETWFDGKEYIKKYEKIVKLGQPHFEEWTMDYEKVISIGEIISKEVSDNKYLKKITLSVKRLIGAPQIVTTYKVGKIIELKNQEFVENSILFEENELPVIKVRWYPCTLLISTRAFYLIKTEQNELIVKFGLDDIEYIRITQKELFQNRYLGMGILDCGHQEIFSSTIPQDDFEYVTEFIDHLNVYVKSNPVLYNKLMKRVVVDTLCHQLHENYLKRQVQVISEIVSLLEKSNNYYKNDQVMKWVYEITESDEKWSYLKRVFEKYHVGMEYVFVCDGYRIVTDKAFYISNKFNFTEDATIKKYEFDQYEEVLSIKTYEDGWGASYPAILFRKNSQVDWTWMGKDCRAFEQILNVISFVLSENKVMKKELLDKQFMFCRECKKVFFTNEEKLKVCPCCKSKTKKSGFINYSGYSYYIEKYRKISRDAIETTQKRIMPDINKIINEVKNIMAEENKIELAQESDDMKQDNQIQEVTVKMEKRQCGNCGKMISESAKFCNFCGQVDMTDYKKCAGCGKYVSKMVKFCNYCGSSF